MHGRLLAIPATILWIGCSSPDRMQMQSAEVRKEDLRSSLFPADQAVMSNDALEHVLDARYVLPAQVRIAVLRVGWQHWGWWTEDLARLDESILERFLEALRASPRVTRAGLVPSILMPPRITVPLLREMAARTQSDLVLLYQSTSRTYSRARVFARDETRAYCVVEAFLLDTRTGVIPFTAVKTETYVANRTGDDLTFGETVQKAEMAAIGAALDRVAPEAAEFLETVPVAEFPSRAPREAK